jgi:hypothetical protein
MGIFNGLLNKAPTARAKLTTEIAEIYAVGAENN